jgi:hypothetical protein
MGRVKNERAGSEQENLRTIISEEYEFEGSDGASTNFEAFQNAAKLVGGNLLVSIVLHSSLSKSKSKPTAPSGASAQLRSIFEDGGGDSQRTSNLPQTLALFRPESLVSVSQCTASSPNQFKALRSPTRLPALSPHAPRPREVRLVLMSPPVAASRSFHLSSEPTAELGRLRQECHERQDCGLRRAGLAAADQRGADRDVHGIGYSHGGCGERLIG